MEVLGFTIPAVVIAAAVVQLFKWLGERNYNSSHKANNFKLATPKLISRRCLSCQTQNPVGAMFCRNCGSSSLVNNYEKK